MGICCNAKKTDEKDESLNQMPPALSNLSSLNRFSLTDIALQTHHSLFLQRKPVMIIGILSYLVRIIKHDGLLKYHPYISEDQEKQDFLCKICKKYSKYSTSKFYYKCNDCSKTFCAIHINNHYKAESLIVKKQMNFIYGDGFIHIDDAIKENASSMEYEFIGKNFFNHKMMVHINPLIADQVVHMVSTLLRKADLKDLSSNIISH